jgi:PIN domain nuclease of toxin-antitoxin system
MILLDTHVLIWLAEGNTAIKPAARKKIDEAAAREGLAVSAITLWEVAMLCQRGRISLSLPITEWRKKVLTQNFISEVPVTGDVSIESVNLPATLHPDPADRILVATSRLHGFPLATRDTRLLAYAALGHLQAIAI